MLLLKHRFWMRWGICVVHKERGQEPMQPWGIPEAFDRSLYFDRWLFLYRGKETGNGQVEQVIFGSSRQKKRKRNRKQYYKQMLSFCFVAKTLPFLLVLFLTSYLGQFSLLCASTCIRVQLRIHFAIIFLWKTPVRCFLCQNFHLTLHMWNT